MQATQAPNTTVLSTPPATPASLDLARGALILAGVCFVIYPALRPFSDEKTLHDGAHAFASAGWLVAHSFAIAGFILLALGLLGTYLTLAATAVARRAMWGVGLSWIGVGLTLPYYGAEAFGLHAVGQTAITRNDPRLFTSLVHDVRWEQGAWFIVIGLLLLAAGVITIASAVRASGSLPRNSAVLLAVAVALFLPQFAAPQPVRIGYGVLLLAGCWIAASALRMRTVVLPAQA
jgi:hypothetical protein